MRSPISRDWKNKARRYLALHPFCVVCGAPATDVDHISPRSQGGHDSWDNLASMCHPCHSRKTTRAEGHGWQAYRRKPRPVRAASGIVNEW